MEKNSTDAAMRGSTAAGHVLLFPYPVQGHLNSFLALAELLASADFCVTFLNTQNNHLRLMHYAAGERARRNPRLRFRWVHDGLPDDQPRCASVVWDLMASLRTKAVSSYRKLLADLSLPDSDGWPAMTCVIADGLLPFAVDVAEEVGVPGVFFRTVSACSMWTYLCIPDLFQSGELPFPAEPDLDVPIRGVASMENLLRRRDLSIICRNAKDANDQALQTIHSVTAHSARVRALILNTFDALESSALSHIREQCPNTYAVGPVHALLKTILDDSNGNDGDERANDERRVSDGGRSISYSLWHEDWACLAWLDAQPRKSVVYISFGSLAVVSESDFVEFLLGLVNSGHRFLMVVRSDLIDGHERISNSTDGGGPLVPEELEQAVKQRGRLVEWAPQDEVLAHPAVGGFLTHSGWNSTLESIVAGVPMLCWPYFADQQINSRFVSEAWKVGLDMKDLRGREVVERMVRELMEGGRAEQLRTSAADMSEKARRSVAEGGDSYTQFQTLIQHIKSMDGQMISQTLNI